MAQEGSVAMIPCSYQVIEVAGTGYSINWDAMRRP